MITIFYILLWRLAFNMLTAKHHYKNVHIVNYENCIKKIGFVVSHFINFLH